MSRFPEIYDPQNFQNGLIFEIYVCRAKTTNIVIPLSQKLRTIKFREVWQNTVVSGLKNLIVG